MLSYSDEEYTQYLQDPAWSRADTDLLFRLCSQYDLRFITIHDRFEEQCTAAQFQFARVHITGDPVASGVKHEDVGTATAAGGLSGNGDVAVGGVKAEPDQAGGGDQDQRMVDDEEEPDGVGDSSSSSSFSSESSASSASDSSPSSSTSASSAWSSTALPRGTPLQALPVDVESVVSAVSSAALAPKSIEDLKQRYYAIQRILLTLRNGNESGVFLFLTPSVCRFCSLLLVSRSLGERNKCV